MEAARGHGLEVPQGCVSSLLCSAKGEGCGHWALRSVVALVVILIRADGAVRCKYCGRGVKIRSYYSEKGAQISSGQRKQLLHNDSIERLC